MSAPAINFNNFWKPFSVAAAICFLYAGVLVKLGINWWTDDNYSHGLLIPFVIGYIVWLEFDKLKKAISQPQILPGAWLILFALAMLLGGTLGAELFTQRVSLIVLLAGVVVYFWGAKILKLLAVPFVLLLFAIPIPQIIFNKIAFPLQIYASQAATWGIRFLGVASVRKGNVIEILPQGSTQIIALEVVEACSGIRSLMTLVTLALVLVYFTRTKNRAGKNDWFDFSKNRDFWRAIFLMAAAIPIAVFTNAARVAATGWLTFYYGKKALETGWHDLSGWLVYLAALALLLGANFVLKTILRRKNAAPQSSNPAVGGETAQFENRRSNAKSIYLLLAILLVGGVFTNWFERRGEVALQRKSLSELPATLGKWRQKGAEIRFDEQTEKILRASDYTMRDYESPDNRVANLYVGYYESQRSGATYHSPQNCLPGAGWTMNQPQIVEIKTAAGRTFTANKFIVENGVYREVLIYWYQGRGRAVADEYTDKFYTVLDSVLRRRSDGAMVRVMTVVGNSEAEAARAAADLAAETADRIPEFVPD